MVRYSRTIQRWINQVTIEPDTSVDSLPHGWIQDYWWGGAAASKDAFLRLKERFSGQKGAVHERMSSLTCGKTYVTLSYFFDAKTNVDLGELGKRRSKLSPLRRRRNGTIFFWGGSASPAALHWRYPALPHLSLGWKARRHPVNKLKMQTKNVWFLVTLNRTWRRGWIR